MNVFFFSFFFFSVIIFLSHIFVPCFSAGLNPGDATYKLQALVLHRGSSAHSGHYIAQILVHGQSPTWFIFDDDYVTPISAYKGKPDVGLDTESGQLLSLIKRDICVIQINRIKI